jgi:ADP-ribose pyrophosphatase YjhB (NUDIX family)
MSSLWRAIKALLGLLFRRPILGVCVIPVMPDGTILLMQRRDTGLWGLPGGLVDWGEDIGTAAGRELAEETGVTLTEIRRLVGVYSNVNRDRRFHSVCVVVEAVATGTPTVADPVEVLGVRTIPLAEALQLTLSHDHAQHLYDYAHHLTIVA